VTSGTPSTWGCCSDVVNDSSPAPACSRLK
jgi:hypothetical protein